MDMTNDALGWVQHLFDAEINGVSVTQIIAVGGPQLLGNWIFDPEAWAMAQLITVLWFLPWALLSARRYRAGKWGKALLFFAIGYEGMWFLNMALFIVGNRSAMYIVQVLPVMGWTFVLVSILTALVLWENGMRHLVVGTPRLVLLYAEKRGWLKLF